MEETEYVCHRCGDVQIIKDGKKIVCETCDHQWDTEKEFLHESFEYNMTK